jgi:hypothetical protein
VGVFAYGLWYGSGLRSIPIGDAQGATQQTADERAKFGRPTETPRALTLETVPILAFDWDFAGFISICSFL